MPRLALSFVCGGEASLRSNLLSLHLPEPGRRRENAPWCVLRLCMDSDVLILRSFLLSLLAAVPAPHDQPSICCVHHAVQDAAIACQQQTPSNPCAKEFRASETIIYPQDTANVCMHECMQPASLTWHACPCLQVLPWAGLPRCSLHACCAPVCLCMYIVGTAPRYLGERRFRNVLF